MLDEATSETDARYLGYDHCNSGECGSPILEHHVASSGAYHCLSIPADPWISIRATDPNGCLPPCLKMGYTDIPRKWQSYQENDPSLQNFRYTKHHSQTNPYDRKNVQLSLFNCAAWSQRTMMEPYISSSEEESRRLEVYMYFGALAVGTLLILVVC